MADREVGFLAIFLLAQLRFGPGYLVGCAVLVATVVCLLWQCKRKTSRTVESPRQRVVFEDLSEDELADLQKGVVGNGVNVRSARMRERVMTKRRRLLRHIHWVLVAEAYAFQRCVQARDVSVRRKRLHLFVDRHADNGRACLPHSVQQLMSQRKGCIVAAQDTRRSGAGCRQIRAAGEKGGAVRAAKNSHENMRDAPKEEENVAQNMPERFECRLWGRYWCRRRVLGSLRGVGVHGSTHGATMYLSSTVRNRMQHIVNGNMEECANARRESGGDVSEVVGLDEVRRGSSVCSAEHVVDAHTGNGSDVLSEAEGSGRSAAATVAASSSDERYFVNVCNTCYIIAWMECVRTLPCMERLIRQHKATPACATCALCALQRCMQNLEDVDVECDATPWRSVLAAEPHLEWGQEQDLTEVWFVVVRCIGKSLPDLVAWTQMLRWRVVTRVPHACSRCEPRVSTAEMEELPWSLNLHVNTGNDRTSLEALLLQYETVEQLAVDAHCPGCGEVCPAWKGEEAKLLPEVECAVICLTRHAYDATTCAFTKCMRPVSIPMRLQLDGRPFVFAACAVHMGATVHCGHYVAWLWENDHYKRVSSGHASLHQDLGDGAEQNATMLFYRRDASRAVRSDAPADALDLQSTSDKLKDSATEVATGKALAGATQAGSVLREVDVHEEKPGAEPVQDIAARCRREDTWPRFTEDVEETLRIFQTGGNCVDFLSRLPAYLENASMQSNANTVGMVEAAARILEWAPTKVDDLVKQQTQLWKCCPYPLVVLFEAYSRATGIPTVFYWDSFLVFFSSLIHRDVAVHVGGFQQRARYWVAGTAQPGTGKSPALEPFRKILIDVLRTHADLAPGVASDNFHVQQASTHAAAVHRLRCTEGYQIICSGEGGPLLCPTWASNSTWNQGTHINLQRYLDTAYGSAVFWDTMVDRRASRSGKGGPPVDPEDVLIETTNVTIVVLQQLSVFSSWWAQGESRNNIGLAGRFLFSFAGSHPPGPTSLHQFGDAVVFPILRRFFLLVLQQMGPKHPIQEDNPRSIWRFGRQGEDFVQALRIACSQLARRSNLGETYITGLQKVVPWLVQCSLYNTLLLQLWPAVVDDKQKPMLAPQLDEAAIRCAARFYAFRFLPGLAALQMEIYSSSWRKHRLPVKPLQSATCKLATAILRAFPGLTIRYGDVVREGYIFADVSGKEGHTTTEQCGLCEQAFEYLQQRGVGTVDNAGGAGPDQVFTKYHHCHLSAAARTFLCTVGVSPLTFAVEFRARMVVETTEVAGASSVADVAAADIAAEASAARTPVASQIAYERDRPVDPVATVGPALKRRKSGGVATGLAWISQQGSAVSPAPATTPQAGASAMTPGGELERRTDAAVQDTQSPSRTRRGRPPLKAAAASVVTQLAASATRGKLEPSNVASVEKPATVLPASDAMALTPVASTQWETIFDAAPPMAVSPVASFQDVVRAVLLNQQCAIVPELRVQPRRRENEYELRGNCRKNSCAGCTWKVKCILRIVESGQQHLQVASHGTHGTRQVVAGKKKKKLFSLQEMAAIAARIPVDEQMTSQKVKDALRRQNLPLACTSQQLHNYVARENMKHAHVAPSVETTVAELAATVAAWVERQPAFGAAGTADLLVVGTPTVTAQRICVAWTTRGMLDLLTRVRGRHLALLLDAKHRVFDSRYGVLSVGVMQRRNQTCMTTGSRQGSTRKQMRSVTMTMWPLIQAMIDVESSENVSQVLQTLVNLSQAHFDLDLKQHVLQLHKDYALGLEQSRLELFPRSRPMNDFAHLIRFCRQALIGRCKKKESVELVMNMLQTTRFLPTIQLFDMIWAVFFAELDGSDERAAVKYLKDHVFARYSIKSMARQFRIAAADATQTHLLFAPHWAGTLATMPGTASGTQAVEAMHAYWQSLSRVYGRVRTLAILDTMQKAFQDHWAYYFRWMQKDSASLRSSVKDPALYNGNSLRVQLRSPARDFWQSREQGNHQHLRRRTGIEDVNAISAFYVMRAEGTNRSGLPAVAVVEAATAARIVDCIVAPATTLRATLVRAGIVQTDAPGGRAQIVYQRLRHLFCTHCTVISGHLATEYWPMFYRSSGEQRYTALCTCRCFGLRAECEHTIFVEALAGKTAPLSDIPHARPKGRPRGAVAPKSQAKAAQRRRGAQRQFTLAEVCNVTHGAITDEVAGRAIQSAMVKRKGNLPATAIAADPLWTSAFGIW